MPQAVRASVTSGGSTAAWPLFSLGAALFGAVGVRSGSPGEQNHQIAPLGRVTSIGGWVAGLISTRLTCFLTFAVAALAVRAHLCASETYLDDPRVTAASRSRTEPRVPVR